MLCFVNVVSIPNLILSKFLAYSFYCANYPTNVSKREMSCTSTVCRVFPLQVFLYKCLLCDFLPLCSFITYDLSFLYSFLLVWRMTVNSYVCTVSFLCMVCPNTPKLRPVKSHTKARVIACPFIQFRIITLWKCFGVSNWYKEKKTEKWEGFFFMQFPLKAILPSRRGIDSVDWGRALTLERNTKV